MSTEMCEKIENSFENKKSRGDQGLLKARGLIDAIGEQGHGLEYAQSSRIQSSLDSLAATGLPIYITELDLEHADDATQLQMYQRVFPLLYEHAGVAGVTLWGYLAGETWKPNAYLLGSINTLGAWTLTTSFQDYTASGSGKVQVHFINDDANNANDVEIDYDQVCLGQLDGAIHSSQRKRRQKEFEFPGFERLYRCAMDHQFCRGRQHDPCLHGARGGQRRGY